MHSHVHESIHHVAHHRLHSFSHKRRCHAARSAARTAGGGHAAIHHAIHRACACHTGAHTLSSEARPGRAEGSNVRGHVQHGAHVKHGFMHGSMHFIGQSAMSPGDSVMRGRRSARSAHREVAGRQQAGVGEAEKEPIMRAPISYSNCNHVHVL